MPIPERICVSCGKRFALLPGKPGLVNTCPECSAPPVESEVVERKPRKKRQKTSGEVVRDSERRLYNLRKQRDRIFGKTEGPNR
jgi:hypothetical protein